MYNSGDIDVVRKGVTANQKSANENKWGNHQKMVAAVKKMNVNKLFLSHSSRGKKSAWVGGGGGMMI